MSKRTLLLLAALVAVIGLVARTGSLLQQRDHTERLRQILVRGGLPTAAAPAAEAPAALRLVRQGADPRTRDDEGNTILILAARWGDRVLVREALGRGAEVNAANGGGRTPLYAACLHMPRDDAELVRLLLNAGANPDIHVKPADETPLIVAARRGFPSTVDALLAARASVDLKDWAGRTALIVAAREGHAAAVRSLLRHRAATDVTARDGTTALHQAVGSGFHPEQAARRADCVKALLAAGARVDVRDDDGWTPLMWAVNVADPDVVRMLLDAGADVHQLPPRTAGSREAVDRLLGLARNPRGNPRHARIVQMLREAGARWATRDADLAALP
jgi:ankyrin repeat protein